MRGVQWSGWCGGAGTAVLAMMLAFGGSARAEETACTGERTVVGQALSASGDAWIQGEDGRRQLRCGEAIRRCETVVTSPGANVGFLADDVYVQVDRGSRVRVISDPATGPGFVVELGRARFVDTRGADAGPVTIAPAPGASPAGSDLTVEASGRIGSEPIPLSGAEGCVQLGGLDERFQPGDVALSAPRVSFPPISPDKRTYDPCELNDCGAPPRMPPPTTPPMEPMRPPPVSPPSNPGFGTDDTIGLD